MKRILIWLLLSVTLGLAPHKDPHLIGKIQWVLGGAKGMEILDWFDLVLHSFPWIGLLSVLIITAKDRLKSGNKK